MDREGLTEIVTFGQQLEIGQKALQPERLSTKILRCGCAWLAKATALWLVQQEREQRGRSGSNGEPAGGGPGR